MAYDNGNKNMTVAKLKELLAGLDDSLLLFPNEVRNLAIYDEQNGIYSHIGTIDFSSEEVDIYAPE